MSISRTKFKGKVRIHGRPREQAKAEIMIMKQREAYENRKRRRVFFTLLDIIALLGLLGGIYNFYISKFLNGFLLIGVSIIILGYFLIRRWMKNKGKMNLNK